MQEKQSNQVQRVLLEVLILNWLVAAAKIVVGLLSRSSSMLADGFHSLSDGMSNIIGLIGVRFYSKPKDSDHPYGHKKFETLFALGIAALLIMVAFNLFKEGVMRLMHPVLPTVDIVSFAVMLGTMLVNWLVMTYEYRRGKQLGSYLLVVDSMHTRADIMTSFSVLIALIGVKMGFPMADPLATILVSGFIAHAAYEIIQEESGVLCDAAMLPPQDIERFVLAISGVKGCHNIRSRGRPDEVYLDLHIQVSKDMPLSEAHYFTHQIQDIIKQGFPQIVDVLVHIEPAV